MTLTEKNKAAGRLTKPQGKRVETRTITRADLAYAVYRVGKMSRQDAAVITDHVIAAIGDQICDKRTMKISSFGTFTVQSKEERTGRNPRTLEEAKISARHVVRFKPSPVLMARVNAKAK